MYRKVIGMGGVVLEGMIFSVTANAYIPADSKNTDWREYQSWLADGNVPLDADTPVAPPSPAPIVTPAPEPVDEPVMADDGPPRVVNVGSEKP